MQSRLIEINQQIDLLYKLLEEKKPLPFSTDAFLASKLLAFKLLSQNVSEEEIFTCLNSIDIALRAMRMIAKNTKEFDSETTRQRVARQSHLSRFDDIEQDSPPVLLSEECQKLQEMIQFYCIPRSDIKNGISRCLGKSYNNLFETRPPIFLLTFTTQQEAELFIKNLQSIQNAEVQKWFITLRDHDFIQEKKNDKVYFHIPFSGFQMHLLDINGFLKNEEKQPKEALTQSIQYKIIFKTEEDGKKCVLRLKASQNIYIRSCFPIDFQLNEFEKSYGFIINENQYTALCKWVSFFFYPNSPEELAIDLKKQANLTTAPIIQQYNLYFNKEKGFPIIPNLIQQETIEKVMPETLFFELTKNGFQIYCADEVNLKKLKVYLTHFGFKKLEIVIKATPPNIQNFEKHEQYLIISHTQIGKLLALHYLTDKPQKWLNDLYEAKKLNQQRCRLLDRKAKVFEENDGDFYKEYFDKLLALKIKYHSDSQTDLIFSLFKEFNEDVNFDLLDHRRYLLALFDMQSRFLGLSKAEQHQLPQDVYQLLDGLKSILIIPENNELIGVSTRLLRHFHQLYEMEDMEAGAPYVLFESVGCCFYFSSLHSLHTVANQFQIHEIDVKIIENESLNRDQNHKVPHHFSHKLIVPPHCNHKLLRLGRFHTANIDPALKQAYGNQGINFISTLLLSPSVHQQVKTKNIKPSYSIACLDNGEQVVELRIQTENANVDTDMGHVLILLDDSGSMSGKKMEAATQACIFLITKLPNNTKVTLIPFCHKPLFEGCLKSELPSDWVETIKKIKATSDTPLVETIVKAAASLSSRCFTPIDILKKSTFIVLTDGVGNSGETAEEILRAVRTGLFRNRDVSNCGHALGTPELPNHTAFPIIPIGIGNHYDSAVIDGLSAFAGNYHIREDNNIKDDLSEMINSVTQTFGYKIGPVYAGLVDPLSGEMLISIDIDMMLPATSRCAYVRLPKDRNFAGLEVIMCVESELTSENLTVVENQNILIDYFRAQINALFDIFANKAMMANCISSNTDRFANMSRASYASQGPTVNLSIATNSLFPIVKENKFGDILQKLDVLKLEINNNGINSPSLLERIERFEIAIKNAENNVLNMDDLRRQQAEGSRYGRGLDQQDDVNLIRKKFN